MTAAPGPGRSPVPAGMRLRPDPGLLSLAGGTVLVGGAPLRLLRLGPRGAALARGWWDGVPVPGGPAAQELARRLLDAGLAHPDPAGGPPGPGPDEVTAVIPVRDRPAELARCLAGLGGMRVIVVDDGSADPPPWRRPPPRPARSACAATGAAERAPPGTPASPPCARRWSPSSIPTASRGRAGWRRCCGTSPIPRWEPWRPGSGLMSRAAAGWRGTRRPRRPSTWGRRRASSGRGRGCRTCRARRCWSAGPPRATGSRRTCRSGKTSTSSGGWRRPAGTSGMSRGRPSATSTGCGSVTGCAGAATTARRRRRWSCAIRARCPRARCPDGARWPGPRRRRDGREPAPRSPGPRRRCSPGASARSPMTPGRWPAGWRAAGPSRPAGCSAARSRAPGGRWPCPPPPPSPGCGCRWRRP